MHFLEVLHIRQQHDANRNKNMAKRERERERKTLRHLRQTFARFLIQKFFSKACESQDSKVSLINACLFQNI